MTDQEFRDTVALKVLDAHLAQGTRHFLMDPAETAAHAFVVADAMLAARAIRVITSGHWIKTTPLTPVPSPQTIVDVISHGGAGRYEVPAGEVDWRCDGGEHAVKFYRVKVPA